MNIKNKNIIIREARKEDARYIADNIREEDKKEVIALGMNIFDSLIFPLNSKISESYTAEFCGRPMCMFGLYKHVVLSDVATIWMLGTKDVANCSKDLIHVSRQFIFHGLLDNSELINYVDYRYKKSLRWLKHLGFNISSPDKIGVNGEKIVKVSIAR